MAKWKFTTGGRFRKGNRLMSGLEMANYASALEHTQPPAVTDELRHLAAKVARHRNVACVGETACGDPDCEITSHNHIVFKTKQARDDWESLLAALQGESNAIQLRN